MPFPIPDDRLLAMLREDAPYGDATTLALGIGSRPARAVFRTRAPITLAGIEEAERMMLLAGCRAARRLAASGDEARAGDELLVAEGDAAAIHRAFRCAQALLEVASGVATRARRILVAAREVRPGIAVAGTRKHLPGAKDVMLKAIMAGGWVPHRLGLSDSVLVFPQHRAILGDAPAEEWIGRLRAAWPERKIAVEAETVEEAVRFAQAGADTIQLDKMPPPAVAGAVRTVAALGLARQPLIAAAGGISEANAAAYAATGVDLLVTSAAYSAPAADLSATLSPRQQEHEG